MRELTKFELAAVKRIAANTKSLRNKVEKLEAKIEELINQRDSYVSEIKLWEAPIMEKYGFSVDEILNGTYLQPCSCVEDTYTNSEENIECPTEAFENFNTL